MFRFLLIASAVVACAFAAPPSSDAYATGTNRLDVDPSGNYVYSYETSNGIAAQESGLGGHSVNGGYSYYSPEGELIQVTYLADENGFQPQGNHLPTPPPTPDYILKALEYIRTHPQYEETQQRTVVRQPQRNAFRQQKPFLG